MVNSLYVSSAVLGRVVQAYWLPERRALSISLSKYWSCKLFFLPIAGMLQSDLKIKIYISCNICTPSVETWALTVPNWYSLLELSDASVHSGSSKCWRLVHTPIRVWSINFIHDPAATHGQGIECKLHQGFTPNQERYCVLDLGLISVLGG